MPGMPYGCQMMLTWLDDPSAGAPGFLNGHLKGSKRCRWSQQDKAGHRMNDGTWWDMMGHDGTWWDMMGLGDMGLASSEKDVFMAWTQRERSFADARSTGSTAPFQCTKQVTAPVALAPGISQISIEISIDISISAHICTCQHQLSAWNGEAFCGAKRAHMSLDQHLPISGGGTTALPWLHAAADAGFDHPNMGVHKKRHRNTLYTYIYII